MHGCGEVNKKLSTNIITLTKIINFPQCISRAILVQTKCKADDCSGVLCPLSNVTALCSVFESAVFSVIDVQFAL